MAEQLKRPGGELASRPLHFFWLVDCSGSMYGEKIGTVNHAIQSTIPEMADAAKDNNTVGSIMANCSIAPTPWTRFAGIISTKSTLRTV